MRLRSNGLLGGCSLALLALTACGGGGGSAAPTPTPTPPPVVQPTSADASRLLEQATFGVTAGDVSHVQSVGIGAYLAEQLAAAPTQYTGFSYTPHTAPADCQNHPATPTDASSICARDNYSPFQVQRQFFIHALNDTDQLRQRVALALSQIFVVSSVEIYEAYGMADYQNMLLNDAFANFRNVLQDVTLSPVMGRYLDMANNDKTDPANGTTPNENYAREVMQLFSIGLYELHPDGTQILDGSGNPIPTYDQSVIEGFAALFTGWAFAPVAGASANFPSPINYDGTMVSFAEHHDEGAKQLLNGFVVPANQTAAQDLQMALDTLFNHPNVGPFIGKQLIQHLVTSNPSPAYVARVTAVFADNGSGVRGDLAAVVKAILTDPEARGDAPAAGNFGHLREPALYISSVLRSMGGQSDGVLPRSASSGMGEPIYSPQTVFNFYPPSYQIPGSPNLAPEFGIDNAATALARANFINTVIMQGGAAPDPTVSGSTGTTINLAPLSATTDPAALIQQLNQTLMHGSLSSQAAAAVLFAVNAQSATDPLAAARTASYLILTSSQYQVER
ncbi:MAG TPA: DUF1800 domain-containing protein [Steroidobacteraceae bacterium]|nr:DUF1800 domain-containing protein [Steroidobacteraceae bacterium]